MHSATVHDFTPAQFRRTTTKQPSVAPQAAFSIYDDLADGIEAIHQCMNLAGFSERARTFVLALASAAHSHGQDFIKISDEDLAALQNCSPKTIQRQRKFYLQESYKLNCSPVEIQEGNFNADTKRNEVTLYRFHLGNVVEQIVPEARASRLWHEHDRRKQQDAIRRATASVYDEIPEAKSARRKQKRPRLATAEIETCQKVVETKLRKIRDMAAKLPEPEQERLLDNPGELRQWWMERRAEMDAYFGVDSPQPADDAQLKGMGGHFVHPYPPTPIIEPDAVRADTADQPQPTLESERSPAECVRTSSCISTDKVERSAEELARAEADWAELEARICEPQIKRVRVAVRPAEEAPPDEVSDQPKASSPRDSGAPPSPTEDKSAPAPVDQAELLPPFDEIYIPASLPNDEESIAACLEGHAGNDARDREVKKLWEH
jgi:hypothetical protein